METNEKIRILQAQGVRVLSPTQVYIDDDVDLTQIAAGSCLYPFTRLHGAKTTIAAGAIIGQEAPATLVDCCLGRNAQLHGGFFSNSLFLDGAKVGSGAHIRECCVLEEESACAHSVGLKHTILFPFVTLGSLINFCDCLMAGGTSRSCHSEVGSSYIHFNFTPHQDKATPSLMGDVARGVMLREPPIFLGGQGGLVGPARIDYGATLAAGVIWRETMPNKVGNGGASGGGLVELTSGVYKRFKHIVARNIDYIANLIALREWYRQVRWLFWQNTEHGARFVQTAEDIWQRAIAERLTRMEGLCERAAAGRTKAVKLLDVEALCAQDRFIAKFEEVAAYLGATPLSTNGLANGAINGVANGGKDDKASIFLGKIAKQAAGDYLTVIRGLDLTTARLGSEWLAGISEKVRADIATIVAAR